MDMERDFIAILNMENKAMTEVQRSEAMSQQAPMLPAPASFSTHTAWPAFTIPPSLFTAPPTLAPPTNRPCGASKHTHLITHRTALIVPVWHPSHLQQLRAPTLHVHRASAELGGVDGRGRPRVGG